MSESKPWPMEPEAVFPVLHQIPPEDWTPQLLELIALIEVYSTIIYSLDSRPLRTLSPDATVDWIKRLPFRLPPVELRSKLQIINLHYLHHIDNLLLGLYYLLLLPIGRPMGRLRGSQNSSEVDCFKQCLKFCYLQHRVPGDSVTPLHCLAAEMAEQALIDLHGSRHRRNLADQETSCLGLASRYAWLVLGSKGIPTFPLWEAFLDSLQSVVDNLPLHEDTKRLAISCLDSILKESKQQGSRGLTSPDLRLNAPPPQEDDLPERRIREGKDARLRKVLERSWVMLPTFLEWTGPREQGENMGWMDMGSLPAEAGSKEFSTPNLPQAIELPLARSLLCFDDGCSAAGYTQGSTAFSSSRLSSGGWRTANSARTSNTLRSTSGTTKFYSLVTLSSFQSQQWPPGPPGSSISEGCLGETGAKLTCSNLRAMENAEASMPPVHQLLPMEPHPRLFSWVPRVGKGIVNVIEKVRSFESELIAKDFDRALTGTQRGEPDAS